MTTKSSSLVQLARAAADPDEELARYAKALAHPARVKILRFLLSCDECVAGAISGQLPLAQSTISQHLKVLREAGLIQGEVDGPRICYCADPAHLDRLRALLGGLDPNGAATTCR